MLALPKRGMCDGTLHFKGVSMAYVIMWLLGVPLSLIVLLWLVGIGR